MFNLGLTFALARPVGWHRERDDRSAGIRTFLWSPSLAAAWGSARHIGGSSSSGQKEEHALPTRCGRNPRGQVVTTQKMSPLQHPATAATCWRTSNPGDGSAPIIGVLRYVRTRAGHPDYRRPGPAPRRFWPGRSEHRLCDRFFAWSRSGADEREGSRLGRAGQDRRPIPTHWLAAHVFLVFCPKNLPDPAITAAGAIPVLYLIDSAKHATRLSDRVGQLHRGERPSPAAAVTAAVVVDAAAIERKDTGWRFPDINKIRLRSRGGGKATSNDCERRSDADQNPNSATLGHSHSSCGHMTCSRLLS